jgi:hypothetical protein
MATSSAYYDNYSPPRPEKNRSWLSKIVCDPNATHNRSTDIHSKLTRSLA